jgi:hypothetical protein
MVMSLAAVVTFGALRFGGAGLNPAAAVGLVCLGPAIDVALTGARAGWRLYLRFAMAGLVANLIAFAVRMATGAMGIANIAASTAGPRTWASGSGMGKGMGGGRGMGLGGGGATVEQFWLPALMSFALCGAIAGLVCAAIWFRARPRQDGPAAP